MKSAIVTQTETGLHPQVVENHAPEIQADKDEVLIKVEACGLDQTDLDLIRNHHFGNSSSLPENHAIGYEFCGIIEKMTPLASASGRLKVGDRICGLFPSINQGACSQYVKTSSFNLVPIPSSLDSFAVCSILRSSIRAYTVLHYKMKVTKGDSILIVEAAVPRNLVTLQLALSLGCRVFATASNDESLNTLKNYNIVRIIDTRNENVATSISEETGGLGVDFICDNGEITNSKRSQDAKPTSLTKYDLLRSLAVHGHWITSSSSVQIDPPDASILQLKNASVSFLFEQAWVNANSQQGRYLHILTEALGKLESKEISVPFSLFSLDQVQQAWQSLDKPKKVIIQLS